MNGVRLALAPLLFVVGCTSKFAALEEAEKSHPPIICVGDSPGKPGYVWCILYPPAGSGVIDIKRGGWIEVLGKKYVIPE